MVDRVLIETILHSSRILCVSHVDPDGDAVGSLLGMYWILRRLGKSPIPALQDDVPFELSWLPGADLVVSAEYVTTNYDLIICLDASSPDRMGRVYQPDAHGSIPLIVIDHHATNTRFGTLNWVEPHYAATTQLLFDLAVMLKLTPNAEIAECLLTGIVTDTLCFRTSNTTPGVMKTAMRLMSLGAELNQITQRTLDLRPFNALRLAGMVLEEATLDDGVVWVTVNREKIEATGADPRQMNLSSILSRTAEADISAIFTEKVGRDHHPAVECSFRAKPGFDVGNVALSLGGGGHPAASGVTINGTLSEVVDKVVPLLQTIRHQSLTQPGGLRSETHH